MLYRQILFLAIVLWASNCASAQSQTIKIGWSGPLTGNSAVVGVDSVRAIEMVFDALNAKGGVNGQKLELVVEDDGYNVQRAIGAYKKLTTVDHVPVIFASTYGGVFATADQAQKDGVLVIDTLDCNEDIARLPENTLCLATLTESIAKNFVESIKKKNLRSVVALIEESDGWMELIARSLTQDLEQFEIAVLEERSPSTATDYRSSLTRAKDQNVEAMVVLGSDQMGLALKQAADLNFKVQIYGIGSLLSPGFQALSGPHVNGALISSWSATKTPQYSRFLADFSALYGQAPILELATIPAYDAAQILAQCLPSSISSEGIVNVSQLRNCFLNTRNYQGISGLLSFDSDGAVRSLREHLFVVRDGKLAELANNL